MRLYRQQINEEDLERRSKLMEKMFAVTSNRMRLVCSGSPGPRYSWPGLRTKRRGRVALADSIRGLTVLRKLVDPVVDRFHTHHPLLKRFTMAAIPPG